MWSNLFSTLTQEPKVRPKPNRVELRPCEECGKDFLFSKIQRPVQRFCSVRCAKINYWKGKVK